jgi:hypothetical protein
MALGVVVLTASVVAVTSPAWSTEKLPKPGTAAQVSALVASSSHINKLSTAMVKDLISSEDDTASRVYPKVAPTGNTSSCANLTRCVFGDTSSKTVIVLYGDSHAYMWLPALAPAAKTLKAKLILVWWPVCPVAYLPTAYDYVGTPTWSGCTAWRTSIVAAIKKLKPTLVLISERTADVLSEPSGVPFTASQWQAALQPTITQFQTTKTKVAVIEDVPSFDQGYPQACMAEHPSAIQVCAVPYPNPEFPGQQPAELAATTATRAGFIATVQWFCTSTCSPVVGSYFVHHDQGHVSATYAEYLSLVMEQAVKHDI